MVSTIWGMVCNKIYLMTEGETLDELQQKGDRLVDMMANERRSGRLSSGFVSSMVFPGKEKQQQNFAAWKKFWNRHRVTALKKSVKDASLQLGFTVDAFKP